ncbi:phage terminase large subunit [Mesoterricola sediminis]|uniref:Terminase n=1 Tax=Mesoterricola sediminis TaxID=2927980 RepID=A0AA48KCP9_9BACT|nr:phage terminase large subunit [Mesoterricola sediminis]BDU76280.1 terminase [Mesoterricola sediminis]
MRTVGSLALQDMPDQPAPTLNIPQAQFLAMPHKYRAFVAGFGSGKTWVGCGGSAQHHYEHPGVHSGYFAPSYPQIRDIFYPTVEEALFDWGLRTRVKVGDHEVEVWRGRSFLGMIMCRSMDDPASIIGFKIGHALVDEMDVMPMVKAQQAWRKIIARMRYRRDGLKNGIDLTTTPEGFKFVYQQFHQQVQKRPELGKIYGMVQASTYDNEIYLPDDYIPSLLASYPENLIDAYIKGLFVNLQTGNVYKAFNRHLNRCDDAPMDGEPVHIGMDFNVGKMASIAHVVRQDLPRAVDEIIGADDTPDMIRQIKERFWRVQGGQVLKTRTISIYPDASGASRKSVNASTSDLDLLRQAGFQVYANAANPAVKDRVNAMNAMFCNSAGERRYLVNPERCPTYVDCLEQQAWGTNGEPDKTTGHDHPVDAGGYYIVYRFPVVKPIAKTVKVIGV